MKYTNINKYGVEYTTQSKEIQTKMKQTLIDKYGVDNPFKVQKFKEKAKNTNLERYGVEYYFQSEKIQDNIKQYNLNKYGVEYPLQSEEFKEKIKEKYGVKNYTQTEEHKLKQKQIFMEELKNGKFPDLEPLFDIDDFNGVSIENKYKFKCLKCGNEFYDHLACGRIPRCLICYPYYISKLEIEIREYIKSIYTGELIFNDRTILSNNLELDIVMPNINIAIEVNGDYWHSDDKKPAGYHENKMQLCESAGYKLYFIWESEWYNKQDKVKQLLKELLS
jgi:hypothetical protein